MTGYKYSFSYVLSVVVINLSFTYIPNIELTNGEVWSTGSIIAGLVFIFRDYAQKEIGHKNILLLMLAAATISYLMSDPFIAIASISAFIVSEFIDYLVFTFSNFTFKSKVLLSSSISVPVDTFFFLYLIDHLGLFGFIVMCLSKIICLTFLLVKR